MTIEDLRLHKEPCEHGKEQNFEVPPDTHPVYKCDVYGCPGGRVPTRKQLIDILSIDYEAAGLELDKLVQEGKLAKTTEFLDWDWPARIVDAALGEDTE